MSFRDNQIVISRPSVLLVTGVGVGLLTLTYVLGVQVGKQSAALRRPATQSVEDELKSMPEPLLDQLKIFETPEAAPAEAHPHAEPAASPKAEKAPEPAPAKPVPAKPVPKAEPKPPPKVEAKAPKVEPATEAKPGGATYNLQLVATPDPKEADRVAAKAKAAGYATTTVQDGKLLKVRLSKPLPKADTDVATAKLTEKGLKPYATKAE